MDSETVADHADDRNVEFMENRPSRSDIGSVHSVVCGAGFGGF